MVVSSFKCASKYARLVVFGVSTVSSETEKVLVVDDEEKSVAAVFCGRTGVVVSASGHLEYEER